MKRLMALFRIALGESGAMCGVSTLTDWKTVSKRVENEGLSFLTITLPIFASAFEKSLAQGKIDTAAFSSFTSRKGCLPAFLSGFTRLIFDEQSGLLLEHPDIQSIRCVRQLTLIYKRIELPCTDRRRDAAFARYLQCEKDVKLYDSLYLNSELQNRFKRTAAMLFGDFFCSVENYIFNDRLVPRHSSGQTADKLIGNEKYRQFEWTTRLQRVVPWDSALLPSPRWSYEDYPVTLLEPGQERPSRLIPVPKTLKTPRLIAMEPTCMQYVQQGILRLFDDLGPRSRYYWAFCQNKYQEFNQLMAKEGSRNGYFATLDLSDASDRVSNQHVRDLLANHPLLAEYVDACRTRKVDVPGIGIIRLSKFASMGSSLCFPFEAMVFATVVLMGCADARAARLDRSFIKRMIGQVRVYGDDIVVPTDCAITVKATLESYGFKVNSSKSFWTGRFRESCGKEYFDGHDVTIVRAKRSFPSTRKDVQGVVSTLEFRNHLFERGWYSTAGHIKQQLRNLKLPEVPIGSTSMLGWWAYYPEMQTRWDPHLQKPLVKALKKVESIPYNRVDDIPALMKFFVERGLSDPLQLSAYERSGRPRSACIKTGWFDAHAGRRAVEQHMPT